MATSSSQRYQENLRALGRQAENALGMAGVPSMLQGYTPAGVSTGSIDANKQAQLGQTLSQLAGQQGQNNAYSQPVDFNSFNANFS